MKTAAYVIYLVGKVWFSEDQGTTMPNHFTFPSSATTSAEDAESAYEKEAMENRTWNCGFQTAYLVGIRPDGGFDLLKGASPNVLGASPFGTIVTPI